MKSDELRLLLAIVLSTLIIIGYQVFFGKKNVSQPQVKPTKVEQPVKETLRKQPAPNISTPAPPPVSKIVPEEELKNEEIEIRKENSLVIFSFTTKGAALKSWKLKKYRRDGNLLEMVPNGQPAPLSIYTGDPEFDLWANSSIYSYTKKGDKFVFLLKKDDANYVLKEFTYKEPYQLISKVLVVKNGIQEDYILWGPAMAPISSDPKSQMEKRDIVFLAGNSVKRLKEKEEQDISSSQWMGYENRYFIALFFSTKGKVIKINGNSYLAATSPEKIYLGPKDYFILRKIGKKTEKTVRLGLFWFIGVPTLRAMKWLYEHTIPNYGFAIILLTILIKLLFYPLTYKSSISMYKMQKLQPKIKIIQEKYKGADPETKKKMNIELMELYKKEGVNPASGCLPLLLQLPILWAFFSLLTAAVELWQQPFILWIKDLSAKDPYYILPVLMGISQLVLQLMTPSGSNPSQQKLMAILMAGFFTFLFASFPAGLVLYWFTYNLLSIGQQYIVNKYLKTLEVSHETS